MCSVLHLPHPTPADLVSQPICPETAWLHAFCIGLSSIEDPRSRCLHPLAEILFCSVCAVASGADCFTDIALFTSAKLSWFQRYIPLKNGAPSHDTFRYVFMLLKPDALHEALRQYLTLSVPTAADGPTQIAVDGKTMRGSAAGSKKQKAVHLLRAYTTDTGACLGYQPCDQKSNEITAIPTLLRALNLKGCLVTIDAMGCQTAIVAQIVQQEGDYLIPVTGNQPHAHEACLAQIEDLKAAITIMEPQLHDPKIAPGTAPTDKPESKPKLTAQQLADLQSSATKQLQRYQHHGFTELNHGRFEQRDVYVLRDMAWWPKSWRWEGLQSIVFVRRRALRPGSKSDSPTEEWSAYLSSRSASAKAFARWVRRHWAIENGCHHVLDVTFDEDQHQVRDAQTAVNFSILRDWTTALLKTVASKLSLAARRKQAAWSDSFRSSLIAHMFHT